MRLTTLCAIFLWISSMTMATQHPTTSQPITRIATFRFRPEVTPAQKSDRANAFLRLYDENIELLVEKPKGGRPLDTSLDLTDVKRDSVWDMGFVVVFKDEASRQTFDRNPGHDTLKRETDPLLAQVFVYDFAAEPNLGW